jgi:hypothetical protein
MKDTDLGVLIKNKWRVGRKVGRTIYSQLGKVPSDNDPLIGLFDSVELALQAVEDHNKNLK